MTSSGITQITTSDRENNPKAVFVGNLHGVINPLALYLAGNNVDLFSGNTLSDAFFGDYFFYVGLGHDVKDFLEGNGAQLPKTLLLLTNDSDFDEISEKAQKHAQIKLVLLSSGKELTEKEATKIIEFFFASQDKILELHGPRKKKPIIEQIPHKEANEDYQNKQQNASIEELATSLFATVEERKVEDLPPQVAILKEEKASIVESERIPAEPQIPPAVTDSKVAPREEKISADFTGEVPQESQVRKQVESFYENDDPKESGKSTKPKKRGRKAPLLMLSILGLFIFAVFPVLAFATQFGLATFYLHQGKETLQTFDLEKSEKQFASAAFFGKGANQTLGVTQGLFSILGQKTLYTQIEQVIVVEEKLGQGGAYLSKAGQESETLIRGISGQDKGVAYGQLITSAKGFLTLADTEFAAAQAELKTENLKNITSGEKLPLIGDQFIAIPSLISRAREGIASARSLLSLAPEVIGLYGEQTFLVLFQNNMELRPTGGFIGSFGLLTFADGTFKDFKVEDVYTADGALKGHIDPPEPIRVHLGQEHWYLRDSNWDPDFSRSGARAIWFLDKELGIDVDGVIAVDLGLLQNVLRVVGPLEVEDYEEKITADNLFLTSHSFIQSDFFPGSTQKRDFLGALGRQLLTSVLESDPHKQPALVSSIYTSFLQKHALAYFVSPQVQQIAQLLDITGEIKSQKNCQQTACIEDHVMVVDANLSVNKSNFFIKRKIEDDIVISDEGVVTHTVRVNYRNESSPEDTKIGGFYKNYVRLIVPPEAHLIEASIDENALTIDTATVASASSVIAEPIGELTAFATLVDVAPKSEKTVTFSYELPKPDPGEIKEYALATQKQPGTAEDSVMVTITYPRDWQLVNQGKNTGGEVAGATTLVNNNKITYNSSLSTDQVLRVEFTP